ncbi:TPA: hypothetical protein MEW76_004893 [Klebsiella aerogenes]|uniref:hypothetical protein n=1 Tax=Citrobacter koseri TaxID=545 RepID=UPI0019001E9D|nr:hypothetical protein [Citrobacter koseri]MBJ9006993.1 hypothetical protein [Citrobacter koseri]HBW3051281.1 hypothetical protein [Klebsiella aerogenes]
MFNELEKERFNNRVPVKEVRVSAEIFVSSLMTESTAEVDIVVPDSDYQSMQELYDRLCQFAIMHGEDLQELFETDSYQYLSCFIRDVESFVAEFGSENVLKPLFNQGKGRTAEFLISFPEAHNSDVGE